MKYYHTPIRMAKIKDCLYQVLARMCTNWNTAGNIKGGTTTLEKFGSFL